MAAMDSRSIDLSVVMGIGWADLSLAREVNDYIMESVHQHRGRLVGFCSVNPAWGDKAIYEVERCVNGGLRGIGELHPDTQGFDLGDRAAMAALMEAARSLGLVLLTHSSEPVGHLYAGKGRVTPQVLARFAEAFPDNVIVCAHWGGGLPFYALMPEVAAALRNVYFDTAASPFLYSPDIFSFAPRLVGADKVLFGSDYPLLDSRRVVAQIKGARLARSEKSKVLGGNAARLLKL